MELHSDTVLHGFGLKAHSMMLRVGPGDSSLWWRQLSKCLWTPGDIKTLDSSTYTMWQTREVEQPRHMHGIQIDLLHVVCAGVHLDPTACH